MALIMLKYVPFIPTLVRVLIMNGCWTLSNVFSASMEMIMWFLTFLLLTRCITLIDFHMLNHPCELIMNALWLWCMIFFMLLDSVASNFFENFCVYIHQRYWSIVFFSGSVFGFGIRVMVAS